VSGVSVLAFWALVGGLVLSLARVFQNRPKDLWAMLLAGLVTSAGIRVGAAFGPWHGSFLGAFIPGPSANLFALASGRPASVVMILAFMLLAPGAAALRGRATKAGGWPGRRVQQNGG